MNALDKLQKAQSRNRSMICVGLDLDPKRMPQEFTKSTKGMFDFACRIIEATSDQVGAYKPNIAFYEALGHEGLSLLRQIVARIPDHIPVILDAKRGDIGNTAQHYAQSLYEYFNADWVTLNPYMGYDSLRPFIEHKDKGAFILCLTSNSGSKDFQMLSVEGRPLYEVVAEKVAYWNKSRNLGLVVGATAPEQLVDIRNLAADMPLLIPGVGAQGGSLELAAVNGTDHFHKPALINVSRSVLYASEGADFAQKARDELVRLNEEVSRLRSGKPEQGENNGSNDSQENNDSRPEDTSSQTAEEQQPRPQNGQQRQDNRSGNNRPHQDNRHHYDNRQQNNRQQDNRQRDYRSDNRSQDNHPQDNRQPDNRPLDQPQDNRQQQRPDDSGGNGQGSSDRTDQSNSNESRE